MAVACCIEVTLDGYSLLQEQVRSLKHPQAKDFLNYVKWRQTVHFKKLENPKVGASSLNFKQLDWQAESLTTQRLDAVQSFAWRLPETQARMLQAPMSSMNMHQPW